MQENGNSFENSKLYHEKQSTMQCAIHAVNNMLQKSVYTKKNFDEIAKELFIKEKQSQNGEIYINPYKNILGLGNYNISVIEIAFLQMNHCLKWWDKRKEINQFDFKSNDLVGFLINDTGEKSCFRNLFKLVQLNHWYSIKKIEENYFDCDSRLDKPKLFKSIEELKKRMEYIKKNDGFIFQVYENNN